MKLGKVTGSLLTGFLLGASAPSSVSPTHAAKVKTENAACAVVKTRVSARDHFPISQGAFCDITPAASSPTGFYVLALHSNRACDGICSSNTGWFAVEKTTGRVFEWDVADQKLGPAIDSR
jgi:hypothetical protein